MKTWKQWIKLFAGVCALCLVWNVSSHRIIPHGNGTQDIIPADMTGLDKTTADSSVYRCTNSVRLQMMREQCSTMAPEPPLAQLSDKELKKVVSHLLVDHKHKLIYCDIPKVGSTTWKHILANNSINSAYLPEVADDIHDPELLWKKYELTYLDWYTRSAIFHLFTHYQKYLVVRHPVERLASAFTHKILQQENYIQEDFGSKIIKLYHPSATTEEIKQGRNITFNEFISYITKFVNLDDHWFTYQRTCSPCRIAYDYIAKLETFAEDSEYIIHEKLSGRGPSSSYRLNVGYNAMNKKQWNSNELLRKVTTMRDVDRVYGDDIRMFGYNMRAGDGGGVETACFGSDNNKCC